MLSYAPVVNAYRTTEISTSEPLDLVIMLYEGALQNIKKARVAIQEGDIQKRVNSINRVIAIVEELLRSLDLEAGGQVAENLQELYLFAMKELTEVNLTLSLEKLTVIESVLSTLLEGWKELRGQPL
jgi:flagellar protein FliS